MSKFTVKSAKAGAEAVIEEFLDAFESLNIERFVDVWHDHGVQIKPYAPEEFPSRLEGKKAIRRQFRSLLKKYESLSIPDRVYYFTVDPNRVWVELRLEIKIKETGKSYSNTYVCLFTLRDGRIIEYKEYSNPLIFLNAFGNSEALHKNIGNKL